MKGLWAVVLLTIVLASCASSPTGGSVTDNPKVKITTNKGVIIAEIFKDKAPITAGNFLDLVQSGFYDGLTYHRYVPGFVIQGGDPRGDGTGGSGKTIPLEIVPGLTHEPFTLAMARSADPNSASSQYYITLAKTPHLDGQYAVFGRVVEGQDVVLNLREGDKMEKVEIQ